jgi:transcriptional regulator GlxA family with amidase domain
MFAQIVLFDGFDLLDAIAPYEVLTAGALVSDGDLEVEFVSAEGPRQVPSAPTGVPIPATAMLDLERADIVVVPGAAGPASGDGPNTIPAILSRAAGTELATKMEAALAMAGLTVATVCGGSLLLAMAGLLEGRRCATHHMGMDVLEATGAIPVNARVVEERDLLTAGGVTSGLDLGMYLLEREMGPQIASAVECLFEFERRGTVWRATGREPVAL